MGYAKPLLLYSQQFSYDSEIVGMVGSLAWVRQNKIISIPYLCSIKNFKKNRQGGKTNFKRPHSLSIQSGLCYLIYFLMGFVFSVMSDVVGPQAAA